MKKPTFNGLYRYDAETRRILRLKQSIIPQRIHNYLHSLTWQRIALLLLMHGAMFAMKPLSLFQWGCLAVAVLCGMGLGRK